MYLKYISGISQAYPHKVVICSQSSHFVSDILKAYFRHFSHQSEAYLKDILGISQPYLSHILGIIKACIRNIFQAYLRHILGKTQRFKCLLTNDQISVNSISFHIYILLMYTEIFAAYAGSCLFHVSL